MREKLKKGDIVENFGLNFSTIPWWEASLYRLKWYSRDLAYWLKKQYQRVKYGFPLEESWNFNYTCARWALPRLKQLRDGHVGFPTCFSNNPDPCDKQKYFDFFNEIPNGSTQDREYGDIKWVEILDKIIWSCEHFEDEIDPIYPENYDSRYVVVDVSDKGTKFERIDKRKIDWSPVEEHERKLQEGFELFGKYFQNLWD